MQKTPQIMTYESAYAEMRKIHGQEILTSGCSIAVRDLSNSPNAFAVHGRSDRHQPDGFARVLLHILDEKSCVQFICFNAPLNDFEFSGVARNAALLAADRKNIPVFVLDKQRERAERYTLYDFMPFQIEERSIYYSSVNPKDQEKLNPLWKRVAQERSQSMQDDYMLVLGWAECGKTMPEETTVMGFSHLSLGYNFLKNPEFEKLVQSKRIVQIAFSARSPHAYAKVAVNYGMLEALTPFLLSDAKVSLFKGGLDEARRAKIMTLPWQDALPYNRYWDQSLGARPTSGGPNREPL